MARTLVFDENLNAKEVKETFKPFENLFWAHLTSNEDNVIKIVTQQFKIVKEIKEDLLEQQRPNLIKKSGYDAIVLSFPTLQSIKGAEKELMQVTFLLTARSIISISNSRVWEIEDLMDDLMKRKKKVSGITTIFEMILDVLNEKSIKILEEEVDTLTDRLENNIIKKETEETLKEIQSVREKLFSFSRVIKADLEVIKGLLKNEARYINTKYFSEHIEDRLLYLSDLIDSKKEETSNLTNLYLGFSSHRLNIRMNKITVIGVILLVPSVISGFFSMNVIPPGNYNFYEIFFGTILFSVVLWFVAKKLKWI